MLSFVENKFNMIRVLLVALFFNLYSIHANSQRSYIIDEKSVVVVSGTSTFHDWKMKSSDLINESKIKWNDKNEIDEIITLELNIDAMSLKSDNTKLDKNAYNALNTDQYPTIKFVASTIEINPTVRNRQPIKINGNLTVAGVTRRINLDAVIIHNNDSSFMISGEQTLKMTDFNVTPPSFMFGAMKTGDEITITYKIKYKPQ